MISVAEKKTRTPESTSRVGESIDPIVPCPKANAATILYLLETSLNLK